jgi:hypothetical protein
MGAQKYLTCCIFNFKPLIEHGKARLNKM